MKLGAKIFGGLATLLLLYLLVGFLLPGTWAAEAEALFPTPPELVFVHLEEMEAWGAWFPMPESGVERTGPARGPGAGLRWDDPRYGRGEMQVLSTSPDSLLTYRVEIEGGALRVEGKFVLIPTPEGTRVQWREEGDFGWNPLMGYAARGMAASQGEAMRESLEALRQALSTGG